MAAVAEERQSLRQILVETGLGITSIREGDLIVAFDNRAWSSNVRAGLSTLAGLVIDIMHETSRLVYTRHLPCLDDNTVFT